MVLLEDNGQEDHALTNDLVCMPENQFRTNQNTIVNDAFGTLSDRYPTPGLKH